MSENDHDNDSSLPTTLLEQEGHTIARPLADGLTDIESEEAMGVEGTLDPEGPGLDLFGVTMQQLVDAKKTISELHRELEAAFRHGGDIHVANLLAEAMKHIPSDSALYPRAKDMLARCGITFGG